jgi:uncharacterized RDD family membrane protein YckC
MSDIQREPAAVSQAGPVAPATVEPVRYGGFWIRVVAWFIDGIAISILSSVLAPILGTGPMVGFEGSRFQIDYGTNAINGLIGLVYFVGLWTWKGQTVGMMPFRLHVVGVDDGTRPDLVRSVLRYIGLIISFAVVLLGVIWVAFDGRKQGWHDKLARTLVIRR